MGFFPQQPGGTLLSSTASSGAFGNVPVIIEELQKHQAACPWKVTGKDKDQLPTYHFSRAGYQGWFSSTCFIICMYIFPIQMPALDCSCLPPTCMRKVGSWRCCAMWMWTYLRNRPMEWRAWPMKWKKKIGQLFWKPWTFVNVMDILGELGCGCVIHQSPRN